MPGTEDLINRPETVPRTVISDQNKKLAWSAYQTTESGMDAAWHTVVDPTWNAYQAAVTSAQSDCQDAVSDATDDYNVALADATDDWNIAANDAWDNYQSDVTDALADWTTDEAGPRGDYNDEMQDAQDDWTDDENTAWSSFTGIETPARNQRSSDIATAESLRNGIVTAATTIWTATESGARSFANTEIALAGSIRDGIETIAADELESDVDAAEDAAESTITGLQPQAAQAWNDYVATLAPGETPAVTQQPSLDTSLAMVPGLSSAVMASMLGGPPSTPATSGPRSTPMSVNGPAPTAAPLGAGRQRVQAASDVHGTLYYLFHPSQGAGPGYGHYLTNPSQMDRDLRYGFYGAVAVAGVAGSAAGGLAVAGVNPVLWGGGAAAAGGGAAASSSLPIMFGHGARHLIGTGLTQAHVQAAITLQLQAIGVGVGASWHWIQINGQWIQYRVHVLQNGIVNVGTYFTVSGPFQRN